MCENKTIGTKTKTHNHFIHASIYINKRWHAIFALYNFIYRFFGKPFHTRGGLTENLTCIGELPYSTKYWQIWWLVSNLPKFYPPTFLSYLDFLCTSTMQIKWWALIKIAYLDSLFTPLAKLIYHQNNLLNYLASNLSSKSLVTTGTFTWY